MQTINDLYNNLKFNNINDIIKLEESDRQFIALKNLYNNIDNESKKFYLSLIIANSIICYQLSSSWEEYWEEFSNYFSINWFKSSFIIDLENFIKKSKWNKRLADIKIKRLWKVKSFLDNFILNQEYYYNNMIIFRDELSNIMKQKKSAKTIVFAVKIFSYWARNIFWFKFIPKEICIPIDSRLTNIFEIYKWDYNDINKFYFDLSNKLNIPELHLDSLVWINYNNLLTINYLL